MAERYLEAGDHNAQLLDRLEVGDMVQFPRGLYSHWAIYIGEGEVVHLAGEEGDGLDGKGDSTHLLTLSGGRSGKAFVKIDRFLEVAGRSKAVVNNKDDKLTPLPADRIVGNALTKLGEVGYSVLYENCEHFASWCRYGKGRSEQADILLIGLSCVTAIGTAATALLSLARGGKLFDSGGGKK